MLDIGDKVTPKREYNGYGYPFSIIKILKGYPYKKYKLKYTELGVDPVYGPKEYQYSKIRNAENFEWREDQLECIEHTYLGPSPDKPQEIKTSVSNINLFDIGTTITSSTPYEPYKIELTPYGSITTTNPNITITGDTLKSTTIKVDNPTYNYYKNLCEKENKNMKILDIYDARKRGQIEAEFKNKKDKILEQDEIQKIIKEMTKQINTILENEAREDRYWAGGLDLYQEATTDKLDDLEEEKEKKLNELRSTIDEIKALFELTEDYQERMKILEKYGIIKNGKVNI